MKYMETAVTHMNLKSFIARVTKNGNDYKVLGVVLNDGTPIKSVEVKVDDGPWQAGDAGPVDEGKYGWKLFTYTWNGATPGRAHAGLARDRREGQSAADGEGSREEEIVPRGQRTITAEGEDRLIEGCSSPARPRSRCSAPSRSRISSTTRFRR